MEDVRPRIESVVENYDTMLDDMRAAIAAELPSGYWSSARNATVASANDLSAPPTAVIGLSALWSFGAAFSQSAQLRERCVALLSRIGERYGFAPLVVTVDPLGGFEAVALDEYGARYEFGGLVHSTLSYTTGSHLRRADTIAEIHRFAS